MKKTTLSESCFRILRAEDLSISFSKKQIIKNISVDIHRNDCIAIIGPNGSGKTTLLRALSGRFSAVKQNVFLNEIALSRFSQHQIAQSVAFVAQNDSVDPRLTVEDYVSLGQIPHIRRNLKETQQQRVDQALSTTGMVDFKPRTLGTLSGGQMQRVLLARTFAQEPEILMLDEPTNHLDPRARGDILSIVKNYDTTTIAVLHDLPLVPVFANRVLVMNNGCFVADGSVEETLTEEILNEVFGMTKFTVNHPKTNKSVMVFEPI